MPAAIVTGGAVRIGRALALHLARNGWDIALHYRASGNSAQSAVEEIRGLGRLCKSFQCDFSEIRTVEKFIDQILDAFSDVRLLINSASVFINQTIENSEIDTLADALSINLMAPYLLMRDYKKKVGKGMIVNILDERILRNLPGFSAYSVSKAGLAHLTELAALEWGRSLRVNAIAPGPFPTWMLSTGVGGGGDVDKTDWDAVGRSNPRGRVGTPEDIAGLAIFLSSKASGFTVGEVITCDGGSVVS